MRPRDVHAIAFCAVTISGFLVVAIVLLGGGWAAFASTGAYAAWLLTRPRIIRVVRRLRGQEVSSWGAYYRD